LRFSHLAIRSAQANRQKRHRKLVYFLDQQMISRARPLCRSFAFLPMHWRYSVGELAVNFAPGALGEGATRTNFIADASLALHGLRA
jgi:hypothetical protein